MEPGTLKATVAALLSWISAHTAYALPDQAPTIALVPHAYLEQLACGQPCEALGVYPDANVVYRKTLC